MRFTTKGYITVWRDGSQISQHRVAEEAYESAITHATVAGPGLYTIKYPDRELEVPITTIAPRTAPPPAPGFVAPNAPTNVSAAQGSPASSTIRVSFTPGTDANNPAASITANKLYGADSSGGTFTLVATLGAAATSGDETGIAPSTQRFYKVTTVNEHGLESVFSSEVNATTAAGSGVAGEPEVYPLEVIYPQAQAAAGTGRSSLSRCYYAYPGISYSITAKAIGGSYPYTWSLSNEPVGMSINASTGVITMANPSAGTYSNIQVTCTDSLGSADSETYSITVGTSGWVFVDAVNGNDSTGTGLIGAPYQTLARLKASGNQSTRTYFRAGTYTLDGLATGGTPGTVTVRVDWAPSTWIAYPGDAQPVIDFEYDAGTNPYPPPFNTQGAAQYFDGLKFYRSRNHALRFNVRNSAYGVTVRNCWFDQCGPGTDGQNSGPLMWNSGGDGNGNPSYHDTITGCQFSNIIAGSSNSALKIYAWTKGLIEGNTFSETGSATEATIAIKGASLNQITVRGNSGTFDVTAIGGNMSGNPAAYTGEICYNNIQCDDAALTLGVSKVTNLGQVDIYRNTFRGRIIIHNLVTGDGPYNFRRNVIINSQGGETPWPYFSEFAISDQTRLVRDNNLTGAAADNIVDANGELQGAYLTSNGPSSANPRGHMLP